MFNVIQLMPYRELIWHKAWADFRASAARTYLGVAWWVLDPLINMIVYYIVFGIILNQHREGFLPFLLVGIVAWRFFESGVKQGSRAILQSGSLVTQVAFHKVVFSLSALLTQALQLLFSLIPLVLVLALYGTTATPQMLLFPVVLLVEMLFIMGVALPMAAILPLVPDLGTLQDNLLRLLFYFSGIFFAASQLPPRIESLFWLNPMAWIIHAQRQCLLDAQWPDAMPLLVIAAMGCAGIYLGAWLTAHFDQTYGKRMV